VLWPHGFAQGIPFFLIPSWGFFSPDPLVADHHLLYRDRYSEDQFGHFREVVLQHPRRWYHFAWNPDKQNQKELCDAATVLSLSAIDRGVQTLTMTVPYLMVLNYVTELQHDAFATHTQFMIVRTSGYPARAEERSVVISEVHALVGEERERRVQNAEFPSAPLGAGAVQSSEGLSGHV